MKSGIILVLCFTISFNFAKKCVPYSTFTTLLPKNSVDTIQVSTSDFYDLVLFHVSPASHEWRENPKGGSIILQKNIPRI